MAQLSSPGVSVTVVDESFYTPAAPGTVPLIVVATQANKMNSAGTGIAPGTLTANAGAVYLLTSQADLGATFGVPYFQTDASNNPVHAGEINEYGLQAAYSFLGVSNQAYVVRANVDLAQLKGSASIPTGTPVAGTYWWNTTATNYGVFQWNGSAATVTNGQTFQEQQSINNLSVITNQAYLSSSTGNDGLDVYDSPLASYGSPGDYAVVAVSAATNTHILWFKTNNTANDGTGGTTIAASNSAWVQVGTTAWVKSWPTITTTAASPTLTNGATISINGNTITNSGTTLATLASAINASSALTTAGITASVQNGFLNIYSTGVAVVIAAGTQSLATLGVVAGTYNAPTLTIAPHYQVPQYGNYSNGVYGAGTGYPTGSLWIKTTTVNLGANFNIEYYNGATSSWIQQPITQLYPTNHAAMAALDPIGGGANIAVGQVYVKYNDTETSPALANYKLYQRTSTGATTVTSNVITASTFTSGTNTITAFSSSQAGSSTLTSAPVVGGAAISFTAAGNATTDAQAFVAAINNASQALGNVVASINANNQIVISHTQGGDIRLTDGTNTPLNKAFTNSGTLSLSNFYQDPSSTGSDGKYLISAWANTTSITSATPLVTVSATAPTTTPANGTLWYDTVITDLDIMINDGTRWRGYASTAGKVVVNQGVGYANAATSTDINGPIISATTPTTNSTGGSLQHGDLWLNSSNTENWPQLYKWNALSSPKAWVLVNNADHTTQNGIIFADARWYDDSTNSATAKTGAAAPQTIAGATTGTLITSDFVDFDAPNPALYPKGMLLWNTRRSGFNVKKYVTGYVNTAAQNTIMSGSPYMTYYYPDRWVSDTPNDYLGVGQFGRKAQRAVVVQALNALINSNQQIRDEDSRVFDIISCPGYLETLPSLVSLNNDRGLLSFIVADAPARLTSDATTLNNWGQNVNKATGDGEAGLVTTDANTAVYYPWGYTTDLMGNDIAVPPSHIMLRTIALSDNVSYPWFAPAGVRRGGVTNASSVGYIDGPTGEFMPIALNTGQRNTLATVHVNPITYIGGTGLVVYGQKTRQLVASSLDRINVARLVIYLRYQLNAIAKPYIFEPNDTITRNEIRQQIEKLLLNLTGERALYDYLVVCDTSNNTPSRIDANELHVDIAIEPVKAVEFIYIPLRLENTGAIKGLSA
jgi:hypothetical protein